MNLGELIKAAREKAGMTQVELGKKVGVSGVAIMRYEKGLREPRIEQLRAIADALEVPTFYLAGDGRITDFEEARDLWREIRSSELIRDSVYGIIEALYGKHKTRFIYGRWMHESLDVFGVGADEIAISEANICVIQDAIGALTTSLVENFKEPAEDVVRQLREKISSDEMRNPSPGEAPTPQDASEAPPEGK